MQERRRREVLRTLGLASAAGLSSLAGCNGPSGEEPRTTTTETETETPSPTPSTTTSETATTATEPARTVTDVAGRTVEVPESVTRVVALGPGALRMVAYLDAVDRVVGVERTETDEAGPLSRPYALANRGLAGRPTVAAGGSVDGEKLAQTDPQVVVRAFVSAAAADELQSKLGVPVVVVRPGGLVDDARESFAESLRVVGRVLRQSTEAARLLGYLEDAVADLSARTPTGDAPGAYVGYVGPGGELTRTQPAYAPFAFSGAGNVATDVEGGETVAGVRRATAPPERIVEWNPEYAFLDRDAESYDALGAERYGSVAAVEAGDVFGVLPTLNYGVDAATALADAYHVGSVLFPSAYEDVDPVAKADDVYRRFVGASLYGDLTDLYGGGFGRIDV